MAKSNPWFETHSHGPSRPDRRLRRLALATASAGLLALTGCSGSQASSETAEGKPPDGFVQLNAYQAAYIGSGTTGSGTLSFRGNSYPFKVDGLGIGGIGVSSIDAEGEVYDLRDLAQFPGAYAQGRYGFALGNLSGGDLWLKNDSGVVMHLKAKRTGLMLSLGGDAMVVSMTQ